MIFPLFHYNVYKVFSYILWIFKVDMSNRELAQYPVGFCSKQILITIYYI